MSAIGPKQTWAVAPHISAFEAKADIADLKALTTLIHIALGENRTIRYRKAVTTRAPYTKRSEPLFTFNYDCRSDGSTFSQCRCDTWSSWQHLFFVRARYSLPPTTN